MKLIRYIIALLSTILFSSTILLSSHPQPVTYAYYHEGNVKIPSEAGTFEGNITQRYDFVQGEIPTSDKFTIKGTLTCGKKVYQAKDLCIVYLGNTGILQVGNSCAINIRVQNINNGKEGCSFSIKVKVAKTDQKLSCSLQGKTFTITEDYTTINNLSILFYQSIAFLVKDSTGKRINGTISYSNNVKEYVPGKNIITYAFTPMNRYYPVLKGSFTLNYVPTYNLSATTLYIQPGTSYIISVDKFSTNLNINYTPSDNNIVTVNNTTGIIKGVNNGSTRITVSITDKKTNLTKTYLVNVSVGNYDQIVSLNKKNLLLQIGGYYDLNVKTAYSGCEYNFLTSNSNISVSSSNGITRALKKGNSLITCTLTTTNRSAYIFSCNVTVE